MEIKAKRALGSPDKTVAILELTAGLKVSERVKNQIKDDVGDYLLETIPSYLARAESPVQGEDWPGLSKKYKKLKLAEGLPGVANMELEGDMLDAFTTKRTEDGIEIGFFGKEAWKADGHLHFSADSKKAVAPQRRFLPDAGEEFVSEIQNEIKSIIADAVASDQELDSEDFSAVTTKSDLYSVLAEYFQDLTRTEIRALILRSPELTGFLDDEGLLELL